MYRRLSILFLCLFVIQPNILPAQGVTGDVPPERHVPILPTFKGRTERALRYRPEGTDFVIENGPEFFNRPLYGANTFFRVDAGDKPEFSIYMGGRGGNLRCRPGRGQQ